MRVRLKVCCIQNHAEAREAIEAGASLLGLVAAMPSGPGPIPEPVIASIAASVPPGVTSVLLTSETHADAILAQHRRVRTSAIQIVDTPEPGAHRAIRDALPGVGILQVVHVAGPASIDEAIAFAPEVDAILLDSGAPGAPVKELGGTGRTHDWSVSRAIVERCSKPVYLAGGLRAHNAAEAVRAVGPFGLDVCSGVRSDGALDGQKLRALIEAVESAQSGFRSTSTSP